jgi:tetratricopeptide (TPR) repeat protein
VIDGPRRQEIGYCFLSMTRALRIRLCFVAVFACGVGLAARPATAQSTRAPAATAHDANGANEPKTKEQLEAQQHFQRAKDLYQTGSYREAITELEQARSLDPKAKDLVFNLGIVNEKLARFDEAITLFQQYLEMDGVTPAERAKAETIITRIEGAKREVPVVPAAAAGAAAQGEGGATEGPPPPPPDTRKGRIDAATITAGSIAVVGLGVGAAFGILAMSNKPGAGEFTTGRDGSYDTLASKSNDAHTQAIVADVGFGVGIVAALVTAYLYFGRTRDPKHAGHGRALHLFPGGGMLGGSFR